MEIKDPCRQHKSCSVLMYASYTRLLKQEGIEACREGFSSRFSPIVSTEEVIKVVICGKYKHLDKITQKINVSP